MYYVVREAKVRSRCDLVVVLDLLFKEQQKIHLLNEVQYFSFLHRNVILELYLHPQNL